MLNNILKQKRNKKKNITGQFLFFGNLGGGEIIIIALVILLLFGGKKIPELMRGLGKGVKSFKDGMNEIEKEINEAPAPKQTETNPTETK